MQKQTINTSDLYQFTGLWGKDLVADTDGSGSIQIDGQTLGAAKGAGQLNTWVAELGAGSGVYVGMSVYDDARSSTGKRLVIVKGSDTANTVTINNFDLTQALQPAGYLGLKLDPARQLVVKEAAGGINTWSDARFEASSLAGQSSSVIEGSAKTFSVYLNQAAQAGETLGRLVGATSVQVNGHSLGGHLATAFTRIFGSAWGVEHVGTFNSAGFRNAAGLKRGMALGPEVMLRNNRLLLGGGSFPARYGAQAACGRAARPKHGRPCPRTDLTPPPQTRTYSRTRSLA